MFHTFLTCFLSQKIALNFANYSYHKMEQFFNLLVSYITIDEARRSKSEDPLIYHTVLSSSNLNELHFSEKCNTERYERL